LHIFFSGDGRSSASDEIVLIVIAVVVVVVIVIVMDNMIMAAVAEANELPFNFSTLHLQRAIDGLVLRVSLHSQDIGNTQSTSWLGVALTCQKKERSVLGASISSILPLP
jgi:hypothetical protein